MAVRDHTGTSHPSPTSGHAPAFPLSTLRHLQDPADDPAQQRAASLAGIAFANHAIACLLDDASALREAQRNGSAVDPVPGDMLAETVHGLFTATYFLNQYAETLMREPGG